MPSVKLTEAPGTCGLCRVRFGKSSRKISRTECRVSSLFTGPRSRRAPLACAHFGPSSSAWSCSPDQRPPKSAFDVSSSPTRCVQAFADDPHPNLIRFYSFILSPSYALCVMDFHRRLMPVSLSESHARPYLFQLLSAVAHLHKHGISHNDIKPSNILLSSEDRPLLIDFGFAQQYDVGHPNAFTSSLSWGTPGPCTPAADLTPHTLTHIQTYRIPESRTGERGGPR